MKARQDSGITQVQMAKQLSKPQSFISKYERGERRLDWPEFIEIADILHLDISRFIADYRSALPAITPPARKKGKS